MKFRSIMFLFAFRAPKSSTVRPPASCRRALLSFATRYTIDCPPTDTDYLERIVRKHVETLDRYLQAKPIAAHTRRAFEETLSQIYHPSNNNNNNENRPLILDSGCGTGRSSLHLGSLYPNCTILGIDRSIVRLDKNSYYQKQDDSLVQQAADNVWLVRAELVDFWHLLYQQQQEILQIQEHYLLYPNPYPKKSRIPKRWYAHPSFPLILKLGGNRIIVRSNWEQYLIEFAQAVQVADTVLSLQDNSKNYARPYAASRDDNEGPVLLRPPTAPAWSNFEAKYQQASEPTYELILEKDDIRL